MCEQQFHQRNRYSPAHRVYEAVHIEKTHLEEDQDIMKQSISADQTHLFPESVVFIPFKKTEIGLKSEYIWSLGKNIIIYQGI